jgi:hypothetical protein
LAELQVERARQSLADHRLVGAGIARWNLPRLAGHWLRSLPLHRQFRREVVTHLRIRKELDRCARLAPSPDTGGPVSPRSEAPPNDAAAKLDQELKVVSDKLLLGLEEEKRPGTLPDSRHRRTPRIVRRCRQSPSALFKSASSAL